MTKSLLLKGLAGVAAVGGAIGGSAFAVNSNLFGGKGAAITEPKSEDVSNLSDKEFIDKAGLNCQLTDEETEIKETDSKECSVKEGSTLRVMVGQQEEEGVTFDTSSGSAKLKVSRSEKVGEGKGTELYTKELKFVVDSGDITLSKEGGSPTITKLGQFETYEIFKDKDKFYLRRRTDAKVGKKNALGLGECEFPDKDRDCSYGTEENIKKIRFEGQNEGITINSGTVNLKITKMGDSDTDFGDEKYRFTFTFPQQVTINGKQLKANIPYDFKIKKQANSNTLTLERAWSEDKEFAKKAGLSCDESNNECTVPADSQTLNVKVGKQTKEGITSLNGGNGKIKMEKDQAGYNQGLKFTITTGDVDLTGGTESSGITKLEELETYEITEEGGKYYLTRKTTREESIRSSLSIPEECFKTAGSSCTLSKEQLKNINFHDKDAAGASMDSGTATLTVTKGANTTDFPLGYKFTLLSQQEITIKSSNIKVKANVPTDFKIKKSDSNPASISLEKAWSDFSFAAKVGLDCTTQSDGCCTKSSSSEKLNVKKGNDKKEGITGINGSGSSSGKIKVEKDQAGYNQGLKFTISEGDVTLNDGTKATGSSTDITKLEELETYEITEDGDKYYLTRKTEAIKTIESQLGLTDAGCSLSGTSSTCSNLTAELLKKINFSDKETNNVSISSGTASLTITKTDKKDDFPLGYKFTLQSTSGDITIKNSSNVVKKNISTDYKIKKPTDNGSLSLEKAWDMTSLGKKVGLSCSDGTECTIDTGNNLKVKQENKHSKEVKSTTLSKQTSNAGSGKIKVTKDQEGYNQGFKFKIEDGSINLSGSSGSDDTDKIHSLGEYETYEIKEEEDKQWYLVRKERADKYIKKELKLDAVCSESENFPHGTSGGTTCQNIEDLNKWKNVNFDNKSTHTNWPSNGSDISLEIKKDTSLPGGFKFIFTCESSTCCLPGSSNATKETGSGSSNGLVYQIKKSGGTICLAPKTNGAGGSSGQCAK